MQKSGGMFFFDGYFNALSSISSDAGKWRMFKAIYQYETMRVVPDEKTFKSGIFQLVKAMIDARNGKQDDEKNVAQTTLSEVDCERKNESVIKSPVKGVCGDNKKGGKGVGGACEQKVVVGNNKNINKNININKNKKNIKKTSSSNVRDDDDEKLESEKNGALLLRPSIDDVKDFIKKCGLNISADKFFNYYEDKNWEIKGECIKDWRACLFHWEDNEKEFLSKTKIETKPKSSFDIPLSKKRIEAGYYDAEELDKLFDNLDDVKI